MRAWLARDDMPRVEQSCVRDYPQRIRANTGRNLHRRYAQYYKLVEPPKREGQALVALGAPLERQGQALGAQLGLCIPVAGTGLSRVWEYLG